MKAAIVKVQKPLSPGGGPYLVYAEGRKGAQFIDEGKIPDAVKKALGTDPKGHFNANPIPFGGWDILDRVDDQKW